MVGGYEFYGLVLGLGLWFDFDFVFAFVCDFGGCDSGCGAVGSGFERRHTQRKRKEEID